MKFVLATNNPKIKEFTTRLNPANLFKKNSSQQKEEVD